jgi:cytochrome c biogenesis protein CcdA
VSLSFIRGLVAAVNPCGFILLPTYLMYFLGMQGTMPGTQRASIRRALLVSAAVSSGFLLVFLIAGVISYNFTTWINENSKYATGGIAIGLLVLGVAMLFGYKLPFTTPSLNTGEKDRTIRSMFVYGIAYAVASIGCTIGLFIATVFSTTSRDGIVSGVGNVVAYGAGMALLVSSLTVALAFANTGLLKFLRKGLGYVDRIAAAFVVLSGLYLLWYFYWVDLENPWELTWFGEENLNSDPITDWALDLQADVNTYLNDNWPAVALVFLSVVGAATAYVVAKKWRDVAVVAGAGVVAAVAIWLIVGTEPWRVGAVTVFSAAGAVLGVRSSERQAQAADPTDDSVDTDGDDDGRDTDGSVDVGLSSTAEPVLDESSDVARSGAAGLASTKVAAAETSAVDEPDDDPSPALN